MKRKQALQLLVGIVLSVAMLWYVFRDITLSELMDSFRSVRYVWLIPCLAVFYFGMWLRGIRWSHLFRPHHRVPVLRATGGMFICFAFNSVFGMRLGEFARAYLVGKRDKTGFPTAFGTVVAERLLDSITLLCCMIVALKSVSIPSDLKFPIDVFGKQWILTGKMFASAQRWTLLTCFVLMAGILTISFRPTRSWVLRLMHTARFVPRKIRDTIEDLIHKFADGLASFHSPPRVLSLFAQSLLIWITTAASAMFLAWGFDFQTHMTFSQAFALVVIVCIPIALIPTPGYWGPYEAGVVFAIVIMSIHPNNALVVSYAILLHLTQWIPIVAIGLPWAWFSHVSLSEVKEVGKVSRAEAPAASSTS
ncbi:flippase-like domain-containing protein [Candidatus Sumerlaeota bacterium]|nr:flippase-like domain-containing protein [Candidatus Sumerlaeota bacterium]